MTAIDVTQENFIEYDEKPEHGTYIVPATIGPDDGRHLFTYLGVFLTYITPHDLTVVNCVLEVLKDVFHSKVSTVQLVLEALKIESGFICLMAFFLLISIIPLCTLIIWACTNDKQDHNLTTSQPATDDDDGRQLNGDMMTTLEDTIDSTSHYRRILQFLLQFFSLILIASITVMFITNELVMLAITRTPNVVKSSLKDVEFFSRDAHKQIVNSVHDGFNNANERIKYDLENVDKLLGEPIQKNIETDSGIKTTLESILGISSANYEIIHRVQLLQDALGKAVLISKEATQRIEEFQIQLSVLQRQCSARDRPLCDTLRLRGFEDNGMLSILTRLQGDPNLLRMLNLGEYHANSNHMNISTELKTVQAKLRDFPMSVKMDVMKHVENIENFLSQMRSSVHTATHQVTVVINSMLMQVDLSWERVSLLMDRLQDTGKFLWILALSTSLATLCISLTLSAGLLLGIIHEERAAKIVFVLGASAIGVGSIALSLFTIVIMLAGGHGEVFLCRPLYDAPHFQVFGKLFDKPGWVYANESVDGIINDMLYTPESGKSRSLNVTLATAIEQCEQNEATFSVFQFERLVNVSQVLDLNEYDDLEDEIEKIFISASSFTTLTEPLQNILIYMFTNSEINFLTYRADLSKPTPEKDLSTFIDQMQRVSVQIQDTATSSRMSTLGNRARRLQANILQPLERLRNEIQFELTALQLQKEPWTEMVNQSLIHLKSTQYFINQDSADICYNKSILFKQRLKDHLASNRREIVRMLNTRLAPCRPLFDIFDANRHLFCHHIIDPLNGLWFSSFMSVCSWAILTPIALGLATIYKRMSNSRGLTHSNSHQAPTDSLIISEQSNWGSRPLQQRQSVRSSRSETTDFTFDEDPPAVEQQRTVLIRRDVTFSD